MVAMGCSIRNKFVCFCLLVCIFAARPIAAEQALWNQFSNGEVVVLMRHAIAPGNGDPAHFSIDDCTSQRNLSDDGREQARTIGVALRTNGITQADVFSSYWCRCLETANLLGFEKPQPLPMLNSFYRDRSTQEVQTEQLRQWVVSRLENSDSDTTFPAVVVTHQVNITAITGVFPASGEMVFVTIEDGEIVVVGTYLHP